MVFMQQALHEAQTGGFACMPNPMVGCVIVKDNQVVGTGFHAKAGDHHAEVNALISAGDFARDADVYVTLEPCSHYGRTPPCVDALIAACVKSVHVALEDPNPLVAGKGIQKLRDAGITVTIGECQEEAYQLNKSFFYYITHKKPFVLAKWAMSLDGKIAGDPTEKWGPARWITSDVARAHAHGIRAQVSAIMVGHNTVLLDDPALTVRHEIVHNRFFSMPRPIVLTASGDLPHTRKLFEKNRNTLVMTSTKASSAFLAMLDKNNIEYCFVSLDDHNVLSLSEIMHQVSSRGISRLLVEGGNQLLSQFFKHDLVNTIYAYVSPKIIGGKNSLSPLSDTIGSLMSAEHVVSDIISLDSDVCFVVETLLMPRTYNDFVKRGKYYV